MNRRHAAYEAAALTRLSYPAKCDPRAALRKYKKHVKILQAGRGSGPKGDGLTLRDLCNRFLTSKMAKARDGELSRRISGDFTTSARC